MTGEGGVWYSDSCKGERLPDSDTENHIQTDINGGKGDL